MIPEEKIEQIMKANSEWATVLYLFQNHSKLQNYLKYENFDLDNGLINVKHLLKLSKPWSKSEKFMLYLAIHLFNGEVNVDLNDMDYLDSNNKKLVRKALEIRFKGL